MVDFEPWEQGVEFEVADTRGVPGWPAEWVSELHEVDSHPLAFRHAGRLAVRNALVEAYGPPPCPRRNRT
ncbi:hypothetical protein ACIBQ3_11650 [Streptomyces rubiginosohelvolus]|uniref:hypothetical protein n=1 Tax=Streptomyces rubiginosohelvolus TaxID=67362 RepID=UPI0037AF855F